MSEDVASWLKLWFASRGRGEGIPDAALVHANYFELGLLSSLELIEFVGEIEDHFGVRFSENTFQDRRFSTIAGLSEVITELLSPEHNTESANA